MICFLAYKNGSLNRDLEKKRTKKKLLSVLNTLKKNFIENGLKKKGRGEQQWIEMPKFQMKFTQKNSYL